MKELNSPLAARLRPVNPADFFGQAHLIGQGKPLWHILQTGKLHSMILWGPPGTGKTTLARLLAKASNAELIHLSAVMIGLKDIRMAVNAAQDNRKNHQKSTILFIDELHRFNKTQQDAFLPYVEDGAILFIGATTENPSFEINNALLSRARVYVLKSLEEEDILNIIDRAVALESLHREKIEFPLPLRQQLVKAADGDARQALNMLEILFETALEENNTLIIDESLLHQVIAGIHQRFDKKGDAFYEQISALHKAVRGSSPDGALYWFARMLVGGVDPLYIARRVVRMASEDIGNADPRALQMVLNAWDVQERLGSPEGELAIAQVLVYLAVAPKSNAVYKAFKAAKYEAEKGGSLPVPVHLRNAPTRLMKSLDYGKTYRYDHDEPNAFAAGQTYFPEALGERVYYEPVPRGLEIKIKEKLETLRPHKQPEE